MQQRTLPIDQQDPNGVIELLFKNVPKHGDIKIYFKMNLVPQMKNPKAEKNGFSIYESGPSVLVDGSIAQESETDDGFVLVRESEKNEAVNKRTVEELKNMKIDIYSQHNIELKFKQYEASGKEFSMDQLVCIYSVNRQNKYISMRFREEYYK